MTQKNHVLYNKNIYSDCKNRQQRSLDINIGTKYSFSTSLLYPVTVETWDVIDKA